MLDSQLAARLTNVARTAHSPAVLIACTVLAAAAAIHRYGEHRYAQGYIAAAKYRCSLRR